jgi:hypothetical protein
VNGEWLIKKTIMMKILLETLQRSDHRVRYAWRQLTDAEKAEVEAAFRRHCTACRNNGLSPEPRFLHETIQDIREGVHEWVGEMVQAAFVQFEGVGDPGAVRIR